MKQFLVFIAILLHCNLYAQNFNIDEYFQKGLDAFENSKNEEAIFYLTPCENYYSQFSDSISKSCDATLLSLVATAYYSQGNYKKAIDCEAKALIVLKSLYGENHLDYATSLTDLAYYHFKSGNYNKAVEIETMAKNIRKQVLGEKHPDYVLSLSKLGNYYCDLGDYKKAVEFETMAMNLRKQSLGEKHPDYALSLSKLGNYYCDLGDYKKAVEFGTMAMNLRKQSLGEEHPDYALSLNNLAVYYSNLGDYRKAVEFGTQAMNICKQTLEENHPGYATSLSNLASYYCDLGEYNKAIEIGTMALNLRKHTLGEKHLDYALLLSNLAGYYSNLGEYNKAVELGTQALNIRKQALGEKHPDYASSLNNLANYYYSLGDYNKAVELGTQALNIRKQTLGEKHPDYASSLGCLANYYSRLGNYNKAIELGRQALNIRKQTLGEKHPNYASSLGCLADYYSRLGNYNKAIELGRQALNIRKQTLGENHPNYATSLNNLANYYSGLGDYNKAVELGTMAMNTQKQTLGENHPNHATSLNNLADYYNSLRDHNKAVELETLAMNIYKETLGEKHPDYASSLSNLASYNYQCRNYQEAYRLLSKSIRIQKHIVLSMFKEATSRTRQTFWNKNNAEFDFFLSFCLKAHDQERNGELYDYSALFTKGLLLNAETNARDVIFESGDTALVKQFDALQSVRIMLNKQYEKPIAERKLNCDSLENVAELMERELIKSSKAYGDFTRSLTITWKDVQNELADGDVAIEFVSSPFPDNDNDSVMYIALALKKGYPEPKLIPLFEEKTLKELPNDNPNDAQQLFHLVWSPLLSELEGTRNVYFSPSGALYNIGIENLPISAAERMSDRYNMYRLSSTRLLALHPHSTSERKTALFGGLDYEMTPQDVATNNLKNAYHSEFIAQNRDASADFMERGGFGALPFSLKEVKSASKLLEANGYECHLFEGKDGTEEAFKSLSGKKVKVMHLSTHGAFVPKKEAKNTKQKNNFRFIRFDDAAPQAQEEDQSLTRSFLVMAGGNMLKNYDSIPEGIDDGILTAQEIAHTDLRGCDLVVLSACETALGDITNEGVMGLQRGFKKAGANTILMSLWKVDDQASSLLLTKFYENLLSKKMPKIDALKKAQDYVRNYEIEVEGKKEKIFSDPKFWTSFILLDGLN